MGPGAASGVALVLPWLESGLDRDLYGLDYQCLSRALTDSGYPVRLVDPLDAVDLCDALTAPDYPLILTVRSQSRDWPLPDHRTAEYAAIRNKTLVTLIGNPPYYDGSTGFHDSVFHRKLAVLMDHDSLDYAERLNRSGAQLLPYRPAYNDVGLEDEPQWLPTSRRPVPILFVGSYEDPDWFRESWRTAFARFPGIVRALDGAAERLASDLALPVIRSLAATAADLGIDFDLRSKAGRLALSLLTRFASNQARRLLLRRLTGYPSLIVLGGTLPASKRHEDCVVVGPMAFAGVLDTLKRTGVLVSLNPSGMTGGLSERVTNAMRRGALVVNAPNSALRDHDGTSVALLGSSMEGLESWLESALAGDTALDGYGQTAIQVARSSFRMDRAIDSVLRQALDPATWREPTIRPV